MGLIDLHTMVSLATGRVMIPLGILGSKAGFFRTLPLFAHTYGHPSFGLTTIVSIQGLGSVPSSSVRVSSTSPLSGASDGSNTISENAVEWNIAGLKKEVSRLLLRAHKKVNVISHQVRQAVDESPGTSAACPLKVEDLEIKLQVQRDRLQSLNFLNDALLQIRKQKAFLPAQLELLAIKLNVSDTPIQDQVRGTKSPKGPRQQKRSRLPYRRYFSIDDIEIRVGKKAEDNDDLSMRPEHRDGSDWWMHASGCPGSHVVIRCGDDNLSEEVIQDAASLAADRSKCSGRVVRVSLTRCRDVSKPRGAKAGMVQLTGNIRTVSVDMDRAKQRLERLEKTVLVN